MTHLAHVVEQADIPLSIHEFVLANLSMLEEKLELYGAVLLRGFDVASESAFEQAVRAASPDPFDYRGGGSPRSQVSGSIYTSTEYARSQHIPLHIEGSYFPLPPKRIWFYCDTPAAERGNTPIGDMRQVLATIDPAIREMFEGRDLIYVSNLCDGDGFGKSWQQAYGTQDRHELESYLESHGYHYEWHSDGRLRVETRAPAFREHSVCGIPYWSNQIVNWHWAGNDEKTRNALRRLYGETTNHPKGVVFDDYTEISPEVVSQVASHLRASEVVFDWQKNDVLILDNEWISHGRQSFADTKRRILVALS